MVSFIKRFSRAKINPLLMVAVLCTLSSISLQAQNRLEVPVNVDIENGKVDDVLIKVMKDGKTFFTQSSVSKMRLKLDFNSTYTIVFAKPGYITKSVEFDTKAPADRIKQGFDPYKIGVKLFKQYDGVNITVYNQPVGKIRFDNTLDEFNYDTDYSKSILSKLNETEEKLAEKAKEEEKSGQPLATSKSGSGQEVAAVKEPVAKIEPPAVSAPPLEQKTPVDPPVATPVKHQDPPPAVSHNNGNDIAKSTQGSNGDQTKDLLAMDGSNDIGSAINANGAMDAGNLPAANSGMDAGTVNDPGKGADAPPPVVNKQEGNDHKPAAPHFKDGIDPSKRRLPPKQGADPVAMMPLQDGMEKITREDIVERNRIITIIKVTKGRTTTEYRRVNYHWGGPYYFKNDESSISATVFEFATGVKD